MTVHRLLCLTVLTTAFLAAAPTANAAFPGPNGRIAFTSDRESSSTSELYSAGPDGSDVKRLTWTNGFVQDPAWSPDGSQIAFEGSFNGRFRIFVASSDGNTQTLVSPDADSNVDDMEPAWSPDGARIAFSSTRGGDGWHVWVMNADGSGLTRLTADFGTSPAWSPDGSRIAFEWNDRINLVNVDGTGAHPLTAPPTGRFDEGADWAPDRSRLVFARRTFDGSSSALYSIRPDGSGEQQLTSGSFADYRPSWSPDGAKIVFDRRADPSGNFQLYTIDAGGGDASQLLSSIRDDMGPSWGTSTASPIPSPPGAPQVQILNPVEGGIYTTGSPEPAIYFCTSEVSFVVSCEGSVPLGDPIDTSSVGTHRLTVTATDVEGRQTEASVTYTVFDFTRPQIDIRTPADGGEYGLGDGVRVDYACTDEPGGSGLAECVGSSSDGAPLDTSHVGTFTFHVTAVDAAGNVASATSTYRVVDRTPPSIAITMPADRAVYTQGQVVSADYSCTDQAGGSGLASCSGDVPAGAALDTSSVGDHTFTVAARDGAGNSATATRSYSVVYDFSGFFSPVAAYPTATTVTAGDTIPLKFSLHGDQGLDVLTGSPRWTPCGVTTGDSNTASGRLSYQTAKDRYTYLASTDRSWAGTCRDLVVTLRDGTNHRARFTFER